MLGEKAYDDLVDHIRNWIFGLPDAEELMPLIKMRFTQEEAWFLSRFPHWPATLEQLSQGYGIAPDKLSKMMEAMIRKGFIYRVEGRTAVRYSFTDPVFFFYRMPGWKGEANKWDVQISPLLNRYFSDHLGVDFRSYPTKGLRTIPIAATIKDTRQVMPYEDVLQFVDKQSSFAVTTCACRHRKNVDPDSISCKHESRNCLHFGSLAEYIVQNEMGTKILREQTLEILEAAADAGLIHGISNTTSDMDTICNCCPCCCVFLEPLKVVPSSTRGHQPSNYILEINRDTCQACGLCAERCPMDAIKLVEEVLAFDPEKCLGCGVCAHKCPTGSLSLKRREADQEYPRTMGDIGRRYLIERGRDLSKVR
ncbi:MAG: 4Fe-4S binding protein [Desulfomonile tiedjei]|uniref:4Fe-4S binding protein n=1 Tax=Desulfomonile tiedjei TaxID=2358 RepID=A0A9D6V4R7_9BACT|nr:4Fe-4S binding protein [Desulfomonile tiedjei]